MLRPGGRCPLAVHWECGGSYAAGVQAIASNSPLSQEPGQIARRLFFTQQTYMLFGAAPMVYLMLLISGLDRAQSREVALLLLPVSVPSMTGPGGSPTSPPW